MNWKKNTLLFILSQNISLFGSMLVQYAIMWYITLETGSGIMMTISIVCGFLPTLIISPFAGVWADRFNRKVIIALSDSMIAVSTFVLALLVIMGYDSIWLLFVVLALRSLGSGIQTPAVNALLPQLAPTDELTKINGTNSSIQALVSLLSPMLSGALLTFASIEVILFIDVITAAIAVVILYLFIDVPVHAKALEKQRISYFSDMRQGVSYIKKHSFIKMLIVFSGFYFLLVAPLAFLTPLQVMRNFGDDVWRLTAIEVTYSVGMMAGGFIMASWGGFNNKLHSMALSNLTIAVFTVGLGIVQNFWIYLILMVLVGLSMPLFNVPFMVLLQQKVDKDYQGRVFGVFSIISSSIIPLSMLVYGPIADVMKIEWLLIGTGLLMLLQGFFMMRNKALIEAGKPILK